MGFEEALGRTLAFEGGYANDPADRGGETYRGVSRRAWPRWPGWALIDSGGPGSPGLGALVADFYRRQFWGPVAALGLPPAVTEKLFDVAVNCGLAQAVKLLQRAVGVAADGRCGPATRFAVGARPQGEVLAALCREQAAFYRRLAAQRPGQGRFLRGWLRRAAWRPDAGR